MKKTSMLIAVFAVIAAASAVRAQGVVDFDNRAAGTSHSSVNRIVVFDPDSDPNPTPVPPPNPSPVPPMQDEALARLNTGMVNRTIQSVGSPLKTYELTSKEMKRLTAALKEYSADSNTNLNLPTKETRMLFNGKELLIGSISGENRYNITAIIDSPALLRHTQNLINERTLTGGCDQNKNWIQKCFEIIVYIVTIRDGIEVLTEATKWVCEQEWVDDNTPTTPAHIPFNPNHVRSGKSF